MSTDLEIALSFHKQGQYKKALEYYNLALSAETDKAYLFNLISNCHLNLENFKDSLYFANQSVSINPAPEYLNNRALLFIKHGHYFEAESDLHRVIKLSPNMAEAYNNLCVVYRCTGKNKKSLESGLRAIELKSDFSDAHASLGALFLNTSDFDKSEFYLENSLKITPGNLSALLNLSKVKYKLCKFDESVMIFDKCKQFKYVDLESAFASVHSYLESDKIDEASSLIIEIFDESFVSLNDLEKVLKQDIFFGAMYRCLQYISIVKNKNFVVEDVYKKAINYSESVNHALLVNLGSLYFSLHRIQDAIDANLKAIAFNPNQLWAYNNLGVCYISQGKSLDAINCFKKTLEIDPNHSSALGWLLKEKCHICDWSDFKQLRDKVNSLRYTANQTPISAFTALAVYDDPAALLYWARLSANEIFNPAIVASKTLVKHTFNDGSVNKKIKIGYYSFDFRDHPVAHLTSRLFELHSRDDFEVYAYSYGPDDNSNLRNKIISSVDHFRDVQGLSSVDIAQTIANDGIDFLIDLTGNTQHNRSDIFALKPAKVQAHWLGFIGTMGSKYYDYIIADKIVIPTEDECFFDENILRIESGFHVNDDSRSADRITLTRSQFGLPENAFVFASFCQTFKIQPEIFDCWIDILKKVPSSVLWLASGPDGSVDNLLNYARISGLDPTRIIIAQRCTVEEYLSRFKLIDLFLDTHPYSSGTVASDALRSGCLLLTRTGRTMVSKMSCSILSYAGLTDFVASDYEEYVSKAVLYGTSPELLLKQKQLLQIKRAEGSLLNTKKFVAELERAVKSVLRYNNV